MFYFYTINFSLLLYIDKLIVAVIFTGGNGSGQGNETEDEDHEFFDAVEEGVSGTMDENSFVIKVPVSCYFKHNY